MRTFQIDPQLQHQQPSNPVADLCWKARLILGGMMEESCDFDDGDPRGMEADYDTDEGVDIHTTTEVVINDRQFVTLSNLPYVFGAGEEPVPVMDPGYVALTAAPFPAGIKVPAFTKDPLDDQLIFRIPHLGTKAAIFHGWEMTPRTEITASHTRNLDQIDNLLTFVGRSLCTLMEQDLEAYQASYLSQVPRRPGGDNMDELLAGLLSGEPPNSID